MNGYKIVTSIVFLAVFTNCCFVFHSTVLNAPFTYSTEPPISDMIFEEGHIVNNKNADCFSVQTPECEELSEFYRNVPYYRPRYKRDPVWLQFSMAFISFLFLFICILGEDDHENSIFNVFASSILFLFTIIGPITIAFQYEYGADSLVTNYMFWDWVYWMNYLMFAFVAISYKLCLIHSGPSSNSTIFNRIILGFCFVYFILCLVVFYNNYNHAKIHRVPDIRREKYSAAEFAARSKYEDGFPLKKQKDVLFYQTNFLPWDATLTFSIQFSMFWAYSQQLHVFFHNCDVYHDFLSFAITIKNVVFLTWGFDFLISGSMLTKSILGFSAMYHLGYLIHHPLIKPILRKFRQIQHSIFQSRMHTIRTQTFPSSILPIYNNNIECPVDVLECTPIIADCNCESGTIEPCNMCECGICLEGTNGKEIAENKNCKHPTRIHFQCFVTSIENKNTCPLCRQSITTLNKILVNPLTFNNSSVDIV